MSEAYLGGAAGGTLNCELVTTGSTTILSTDVCSIYAYVASAPRATYASKVTNGVNTIIADNISVVGMAYFTVTISNGVLTTSNNMDGGCYVYIAKASIK